jgi:tRNA 2-selenouridine synthase
MVHRKQIIEIEAVSDEIFDDIIDVRSPSEFAEDHIPGAINCPVLDNDQHVEIGTLYKQVSPFVAKKKGAAMISRNIATHVDEKFCDKEKSWRPLVYCWRGGMRSGSMQTVLRAVGWDAALLKGGYKAYRTHVLVQLEDLPARFKYVVVGGPTGSGKTDLLGVLEEQGAQVLDLEGIAGHRGSVLGFDPEIPRQSQKGFDTKLVSMLQRFDPARPVFVEAESRRIGIVHLPAALYETMKQGRLVIVDVPMEERVAYLSREYVWFKENPDKLKDKLLVLKEIRGKKTIGKWFELIDAGQWDAFVEELLSVHYDPLYNGSSRREYTDENARHVMQAAGINAQAFAALAGEILGRFG